MSFATVMGVWAAVTTSLAFLAGYVYARPTAPSLESRQHLIGVLLAGVALMLGFFFGLVIRIYLGFSLFFDLFTPVAIVMMFSALSVIMTDHLLNNGRNIDQLEQRLKGSLSAITGGNNGATK